MNLSFPIRVGWRRVVSLEVATRYFLGFCGLIEFSVVGVRFWSQDFAGSAGGPGAVECLGH